MAFQQTLPMHIGMTVIQTIAAMLGHEGTNHWPSPNAKAPAVTGIAPSSSCQPVSTSTGTSTLPRLMIRVPIAQPIADPRPKARPRGAAA